MQKLIPVNIVVMIISLVAALSLLFMPIFSVDFAESGAILEEIIPDDMGTTSDGDDFGADKLAAAFTTSLSDGLKDVKINLTTMSFLKLAGESDPVDMIEGKVAEILGKVADKTFVTAFVSVAQDKAKEYTDLPVDEVDVEAVYNKVKELESTNDPDAAIADIAATLSNECNIPDGNKEEFENGVKDMFGEIYDQTVEKNGEFTIEAMVCIAITGGSEESENPENPDLPANPGEAKPDGDYAVSYKDFISQLLDDETADTMNQILRTVGIAMGAMLAFYAGVWLILFLFALIHTFTPNKKVAMWYVKLFGIQPCLTFWLAPFIFKTLVAKNVIALGETAAILGMFSSFAWISGICYVLLWGVSIFWAHPIKKRLK